MKKMILSLLLTFSFIAQAMAEDITNPFYMPLKGKALSETSFVFRQDKFDENGLYDVNENTFLTEKVSLGVSDNFSFSAVLGNRFMASGDADNFYWGLGALYALAFENHPELLTQIGVDYHQEGHYKDVDVFARIGYIADIIFLPYAEFRYNQPIDYGKDKNEAVFSARVAGYSMLAQKVGITAGLDMTFNHEGSMRYRSEGVRRQAYSLFGTADFVVSEKIAIGLSGDWLFHESGISSTGYSVGAHVKIAF